MYFNIAFLMGVMLAFAPANAKASAYDPDSCAQPVYPKSALRSEQQGTVKLEFRIGADGKVLESRIAASSGFPMLDITAQRALEGCTFKPGGDGKWTPVHYVWTLDDTAPPHVPFAKAPPALRPFLLEAMQADRIADPLQRCLVFPDLPGNHWRAGMAAAYCQTKFEPVISVVQMAALVERGAFDELEAMFQRDLERHFSKDNFSEVIHRDLTQMDTSDAHMKLVSRWLKARPQSPFANAMRANQLHYMASKARGEKYISETPREDIKRMSELIAKAVPYNEKALQLEPRLLPALVGLLQMARIDSREQMAQEAFVRAGQLDPACREMAKAMMTSLEPRWGGSEQAMHAYAQHLATLVAARPLLGMALVLPEGDQADLLYKDEKYQQVIKVLEPTLDVAPHPDLLALLGESMMRENADPWRILSVLLVAYRFDEAKFQAAVDRGAVMQQLGEAEWALKSLQTAQKLEPEHLYPLFHMGRAYLDLKQYALAEPLLLRALGNTRLHQLALLDLTSGAIDARLLDKGQHYSDQFIKAYPKDSRAWSERARLNFRRNDADGARSALVTFLKVADHLSTQEIDRVEQQIKALDKLIASKQSQ
ncbi:MAG: TonB family protein [Pseudomonadota bacterium]